MMITLNLNLPVKGLDDLPMRDDRGQELKMSHVAADVLAKSKGEPLKAFDLATRLWKEGAIPIDQADYEFIRAAIMEAPLYPLVKVPIVRAMDKARREAEEAGKI